MRLLPLPAAALLLCSGCATMPQSADSFDEPGAAHATLVLQQPFPQAYTTVLENSRRCWDGTGEFRSRATQVVPTSEPLRTEFRYVTLNPNPGGYSGRSVILDQGNRTLVEVSTPPGFAAYQPRIAGWIAGGPC
ncbi:hypothetical protein [Roseomonas elaeocarpi]|uniref:Lipoprotein n=1 Tax=Roseomonas elaeocarpi TaxID=907779 RepID=A0ABV6JTS9_9PROT